MHVEVLGGTVEIAADGVDAPASAVRDQLHEYAAGERREFDLPVSIPATFTGRVMAELRRIPYGETRTYGDLADHLGTSPRAVGGACGRNPIPVIVPCHRVVRADGGLGGYSAGGGVALKGRLLDHETRHGPPATG